MENAWGEEETPEEKNVRTRHDRMEKRIGWMVAFLLCLGGISCFGTPIILGIAALIWVFRH